MPTVKGRTETKRFIGSLPGQIEAKLLRRAARAAANVVADEARDRLGSRRATVEGGGKVLIADAVKVPRVTSKGGTIIAKVHLKGRGAYVGPWLEYGTSPHFIRVDASQREGRTVARINRQAKEPDSNHSLVIGGHFVGSTVFHPGARPHPFLRVSLDVKEADAIAAAQSYLTAHVKPSGIVGAAEPESEA